MSSGRKNVLMVTLDCVRPDHLGCYGYKGVATPEIDALAEKGIVCEQAFCQAPNTWVSHASIFTGCNPLRHGIHSPYDRLEPSVPTIAGVLRERGYRTASFPAHNLVGKMLGLDRGFDVVGEKIYKHFSETRSGALWRPDWSDVVDGFSSWLDAGKGPFMTWIHYIETHKLPEVDLPEAYCRDFSSAWQFYDGKISYGDTNCVRRLTKILEERGLLEDTLVVLFADHGEEIEKGKEPTHNRKITDGAMRIPIIFADPAGKMPRGRIKSQVRSIDIAPTVFDLLEIDEAGFEMDGESILPILHDAGVRKKPRDAYMENLPEGTMGLRTEYWKVVLKTAMSNENDIDVVGVEGLYPVKSDAVGGRDLSEVYPEVLLKAVERLKELVDDSTMPTKRVDQEETKTLGKTLTQLDYL